MCTYKPNVQKEYISVKLPDDVMQHFGKHYGIRKDDQISSILGKSFYFPNE
jgi:hypothetical protein